MGEADSDLTRVHPKLHCVSSPRPRIHRLGVPKISVANASNVTTELSLRRGQETNNIDRFTAHNNFSY